jgi:hypothetical protein
MEDNLVCQPAGPEKSGGETGILTPRLL